VGWGGGGASAATARGLADWSLRGENWREGPGRRAQNGPEMDCEPHGPAKDTERGGWDDERDGQGSRILKLVDQSFCDFFIFYGVQLIYRGCSNSRAIRSFSRWLVLICSE
jgi:hypothetical protein